MTLDDVLDLFDLWREEPPVQWMLQLHWGIEPKHEESKQVDVPETFKMPQVPFKP